MHAICGQKGVWQLHKGVLVARCRDSSGGCHSVEIGLVPGPVMALDKNGAATKKRVFCGGHSEDQWVLNGPTKSHCSNLNDVPGGVYSTEYIVRKRHPSPQWITYCTPAIQVAS